MFKRVRLFGEANVAARLEEGLVGVDKHRFLMASSIIALVRSKFSPFFFLSDSCNYFDTIVIKLTDAEETNCIEKFRTRISFKMTCILIIRDFPISWTQ